MGFHPLFSFNCGRRTGALSRALAPQPGEAWLTFGWYIFHQEPSCCRFHLPRSKDWVSRDIPDARTSGLHRIDRDLDDAFASWHRALGAWEVTAAIAIFSLGTTSLRLKACRVNTKPSSKFFVKLERLKTTSGNLTADAHFHRKPYQVGGARHAQLGFDRGGGVGHRLVAKTQLLGDFGEAAAFTQ